MSNTFTVANDEALVSAIESANEQIIYIAPGISSTVAKALGKRFPDIGRLAITLIIDVDPEIYRLGYGDQGGLETIKRFSDDHLLELRKQPGIRIGVLVTDDQTLIYSPIPQLIEAGSSQPEKPNAIVIPSVAPSIERACACDENSLPEDAEIGQKVVNAEELAGMKKDLDEVPPRKFDVARIERVFNSLIQYVDLNVTGYKLSTRIAPIPSDLMGLADDPELEARWRNAFRMFDGENRIRVIITKKDKDGNAIVDEDGEHETMRYGEKELEDERKRIEKDFFYKVPNYGSMIFRSRRDAFDQRMKQFETRIEDYQKAVSEKIQQSINDTIDNLVDVLLPRVKDNIPDRYLKSVTSTKLEVDELAEIIKEDLKHEFGKPNQVASPKIKLRFKDVTYESIHDNGFRTALEKLGIQERLLNRIFSEHDAAPEHNAKHK